MCNSSPLFDQTVTVYRLASAYVEHQVIDNCYFVWEDTLQEDEIGEHTNRKFQLIIPGPEQQVFTGNKVLPGIGPIIKVQQWQAFIPAKVENLCEVAYVSPRYFRGQLSHIEAGQK